LGGPIQIPLLIAAIVLAILGPAVAQLLYFAISRRREYLADASAVRLTRYPEGLASALEKLSLSRLSLATANRAMAPLYLINPLRRAGLPASDMTSTHPLVSERIGILRGMAGGADFRSYQRAYSAVKGAKGFVIPASQLRTNRHIPVRTGDAAAASTTGATSEQHAAKAREIGDLMRAVHGFTFLACSCGLKIKLPPEFKQNSLRCPRCQAAIAVPIAAIATAAQMLGQLQTAASPDSAPALPAPSPATAPMIYTRTGNGWESFSCTCGRIIQLSPAFSLPSIRCRDCGKSIAIKDCGAR
jgi:heat shock protein HtpX